MTAVAQELPDRIRRLREQTGLSHDRIAERLGTTRQVVIRWEQGRNAPSRESLRKLRDAFPDTFPDDEPGEGDESG